MSHTHPEIMVEQWPLGLGGNPICSSPGALVHRQPLPVRIPLTLTLSPMEREQPGPVLTNLDGPCFADRLTTVPPLPLGEGRGEGNHGGVACNKQDARLMSVQRI